MGCEHHQPRTSRNLPTYTRNLPPLRVLSVLLTPAAAAAMVILEEGSCCLPEARPAADDDEETRGTKEEGAERERGVLAREAACAERDASCIMLEVGCEPRRAQRLR